MGVLLQGFFKLPPNDAVPSPADGNAAIPWWWDHLASQANALRQAGFTAVWLPPELKTSSGASPGSDGYGPFDDYDIGSKNQKGSIPTRFGTREQLQRCVATMRANGIDVYLDMVEHQRSGDEKPFVFRYPGANGAADAGRFPKNPLNFLPQVPRDPDLGGPPADDIAFGRELAPINAKPARYVFDNLIDASDWLTRALDVQGYRVDDVKGLSTDFLLPFLNAKSMAGKFAVGEFFDGNPGLVEGWIANPRGMQSRASAFDFPLKFMLNTMCNNGQAFNMASLDHAGLTGIDPIHSVTFVENHDTDLSAGNKIIFNKIFAYAYILTSEGYPCVYYRDYSTDVDCFGLKPLIDNLVWIHEKLADGPTQQRFLDQSFIAYERLGGPHLLVGLNANPGTARTVNVLTAFGPNVALHDYTGHSGDVFTDGNGTVTITVPANNNGAGYVCYSRAGIAGGFDAAALPVTQDFDGAPDLDIGPALNGQTVTVGQVWSGANTTVKAVLRPDMTGWAANTSIKVEIVAPDNISVVATATITNATPPGTAAQANANAAGFYTFRLTTANASGANLNPKFTLSVTYTGDALFQPQKPAADRRIVGEWAKSFDLMNVAIHAHVLPTGNVLYWGRRTTPGEDSFASLNEHQTHSFILDPITEKSRATKSQPLDATGQPINLFCSSHTFLADGKLMVLGGHFFDSQGIASATIFNSDPDPEKETWSAVAAMKLGRWYPTAITLADGNVLVCSGSHAIGTPKSLPDAPDTAINNVPQVWDQKEWIDLSDFDDKQADFQHFLFPRMHLAPKGQVFMSGAGGDGFFLDTTSGGKWTKSSSRHAGFREYAPSVMYDVGKIIYIGGGNDNVTNLPSQVTEVIDLNQTPPAWKELTPTMHFRRRQHNATLLPDGTVLVTGGTQGGGGPTKGFNDLTDKQPQHAAELWDPVSGKWTIMDSEDTDRCYHSTAVLLPDGRVLSAGGGEYQPVQGVLKSNDPGETHKNAQIFSPPYLFKEGTRPDILNAPTTINYGRPFQVGTSQPGEIAKASLVRLSSCTHSFNTNQRINFLVPTAGATFVSLTAPLDPNQCPPGHYMLFLLNKSSVPSVGKIVNIQGQPAPVARFSVKVIDNVAKDAIIAANAKRPPVVVGLTATCPYGLAACWGGAYAGLTKMSGVDVVRPVADSHESVAFLYLDNDGLPDLADWPTQFARSANGSYAWRGVEVTLSGAIENDGNSLALSANQDRPKVALAPLQPLDKVQLVLTDGVRDPLAVVEAAAFQTLFGRMPSISGQSTWTVTGPLLLKEGSFVLEVRQFQEVKP